MKRNFTINPELIATPGQRIANYLLDYVMQVIFLFGLFFIWAFIAILMGYSEKQIIEAVQRLSSLGQYAMGLVVLLIYYNFWEILFARTIGKFITKTIVVDEFGEKPTTNEILLRSICRAIPFEFLTFLGTPSRGWHDSLSGTYVVQKELLEAQKKSFYSLSEIGETPEP